MSGDPNDSPPKWLLTRCGFTDASDGPPFVAVDTLKLYQCRSAIVAVDTLEARLLIPCCGTAAAPELAS